MGIARLCTGDLLCIPPTRTITITITIDSGCEPDSVLLDSVKSSQPTPLCIIIIASAQSMGEDFKLILKRERSRKQR